MAIKRDSKPAITTAKKQASKKHTFVRWDPDWTQPQALKRGLRPIVVINKIDSMLTEYTPVAFLRIDSNKFGFLITELVKKFFAYTSESLICYAGPDF